MKEENERSSLLPIRTSTTSRPSIRQSIKHIEQVEKDAHRLVQEVNDTDSINGLLGGDDDDYSVGSGIVEMFDGDHIGTITVDDLEYLSGKRSSTLSDENEESTHSRGSVLSRKAKLVDKMGEQLLNAATPESEQRILRQSLKLDPRNIPSSFDLESEEEQKQPKQVSDRVHESTRALRSTMLTSSQRGSRAALLEMMREEEEEELYKGKKEYLLAPTTSQICRMLAMTLLVMVVLYILLSWGTKAVGPPRLPVGEYKIVEAQVGQQFFQYYEFYAGKDSAGSNGYIMYVSREVAEKEGIVQVVTESVEEDDMIEVYEDGDGRQEIDWLLEDLEFLEELKRKKVDDAREVEDSEKVAALEKKSNTTKSNASGLNQTSTEKGSGKKLNKSNVTSSKKKNANRHLQNKPPKLEAFNPDPINNTNATTNNSNPTETFVILSSSPTKEGPRNSIRLEGRRRFNRGLFIIDLRHMPAGCGTWPAFWLTDEANWPVNGEIDIVEGVNYQDTAKTALHTTKECRMDDVPEGSKTGTWDTAVGIPDKKTGLPDMTFRYAEDCFVYDPHQWINQGCVATDLKLEGRSLGVPLNQNGGGVYALEWDPTNTHIRTWVFSPHGRVPRNLRDAMRTATNADEETRVAPDTTKWGLPYGHFPIGDGTNCPAEHFRNMRLVINLAFCGSVAGTRYFMDCPKQFKKYKTCEEWLESEPEELKEAYWKIRGVYVYEREWQKKWS